MLRQLKLVPFKSHQIFRARFPAKTAINTKDTRLKIHYLDPLSSERYFFNVVWGFRNDFREVQENVSRIMFDLQFTT